MGRGLSREKGVDMTDKNGIGIKTGDIVRIEGAYHKRCNGFWFVSHSPGDPGWGGGDHCLIKLLKSGRISKQKDGLCFWPIFVTSNKDRYEANNWNRKNATIEVVTDIPDAEVKGFFKEKAKTAHGIAQSFRDAGWSIAEVEKVENTARFYEGLS